VELMALTPYQWRCLDQTSAWAQGHVFHNAIDDECCPDFSCCKPEMFIQDKEKRIAILHDLQIRYKVLQ
jgi:hypothetical protein